ncbi:carboxypeptidase-like regulatory domain-containing protein [Leeuwenhoekiella palythoae]|uniref:carboxypeptidase-like regulatory domain-containing protein n=1 Tax=Leeuwenhoekiella palythoae TaxID=573501 RepID=UPI001CE08825|nr:carboxypeptidase-like regulatory domain-containing protein [Leeuwenhoekiella palythoae]UBZ10657.1 carboxypeptidase-like regulatory domain-containing protein [Leeuwenhoekiella palythoae]
MRAFVVYFLMFLGISYSLFAQTKQEVSGYVTSFGTPVVHAKVAVVGTDLITATDSKGYYTIEVTPRQELQFSYVGLQTVTIIIEDVTRTLNVKMLPEVNDLDEVTVKEKIKKIEPFSDELGEDGKPKWIPTSMGPILTQNGATSYVRGEDLNLGAPNLALALDGHIITRKYISILAPQDILWDIDGVLFDSTSGKLPPLPPVSEVHDVMVLRSLTLTNRYGSRGRSGVIVVRTKGAYFFEKQQRSKRSYVNPEVYSEDAIAFKNVIVPKPNYLKDLENSNTLEEAFSIYEKSLINNARDVAFYADVAQYFYDKNAADKAHLVLSEMEAAFVTNAEALKVLAYTYEANADREKALSVYKKIFRLRPQYAQSYRDLGNSFAAAENYQKSWLMYMGYMNTADSLSGTGIDAIVYREMEALYFQHKDKIDADAKFSLPENKSELAYDVRLVFEWNTSEAEFELEFVNPQNQPFSVNHTLEQNLGRIRDEKLKGYTSEEFLIDDLGSGDWLVNLKYFGNKQFQPTFLKVTTYYNWQQSNQKQKVEVFKLTRQNIKMQLLKLNNRGLRI